MPPLLDRDKALRSLQATPIPALRDGLQENYLPVQYAFVQFLSEHLVDCRKAIGGDLDEVMLLAVLGQRFMGSMLHHRPGAEGKPRTSMSALRIADVTGIPRESVRRKLTGLAERGWVVSTPGHGWSLAATGSDASARAGLSGLDQRGLDRLARLVSIIQRIVAPVPEKASMPR